MDIHYEKFGCGINNDLPVVSVLTIVIVYKFENLHKLKFISGKERISYANLLVIGGSTYPAKDTLIPSRPIIKRFVKKFVKRFGRL